MFGGRFVVWRVICCLAVLCCTMLRDNLVTVDCDDDKSVEVDFEDEKVMKLPVKKSDSRENKARGRKGRQLNKELDKEARLVLCFQFNAHWVYVF